MSVIGNVNLKVLLLDTDFYALQALNGYLAWDRRTRVTFMAESTQMMWDYLNQLPAAEYPDVIVMDADHSGGAASLKATITALKDKIPGLIVICLAQVVDVDLVQAAVQVGVRGYFLKQEARLQIAWAIVYALDYPLVITRGIAKQCSQWLERHKFDFVILPDRREYPELTDRIRQAIKLCVIEGMPAHLAADEMGISLHTIRGYIKEGYRILESYDESDYPVDMTPQERAFMRFTALDIDTESQPPSNS
ncbi:MAG: hypothetical protein Kow00117_21690 [Phototrophicales bacterium]